MTGLLREVGRVRHAMEEFTAAQERIEVFSVRLEELALMHAGDSFALLTGSPGVDAAIIRQLSQADSAPPPLATEGQSLRHGRGSDGLAAERQSLPHGGGSDGLAAQRQSLRHVSGSDGLAAQRQSLPHGGGSDGIVDTTRSPIRAATVRERSYARTPGLATETRSSPPGEPAIGGTHRSVGVAAGDDLGAPSASRQDDPLVPFADSTTVLAQRFEHAGLTTAWEATFHTAAEPRPPASAVTQTGGQAPAITTVVSQQLLRTVERAERTGRARTLSQARPGHTSRQAPMPAEDRESVPQRPLTPAEAEKLRAATTIAPASSVTPRQWPAPATITHDRGWEAKAEDDAAPRQRWVPPTGTGLRRLASLVGVPPGEPAHEDAALAPRAAGLPDRERTPLHGAPGAGPADFVSCLGEALRAEAIRSGIDPEELIR